MTLGDFRKITEQYGDDCELFWCRDLTQSYNMTKVHRVLIDVIETENDPFSLTPDIILL